MNIGADDYITKPFNIEEVAASIKARFEKAGILDDYYTMKFNSIIDGMEERFQKNQITGIPNIERLDKDIEMEKNYYDGKLLYFLFCIEIDGSKELSCYLGSKSVENILKGIAEKIRKNMKEYSILYHINEFEFAILSKVGRSFIDSTNIDSYAQEILESISEPFSSKNFNFTITSSIGISVMENKEEFDEALKNSRTAKFYVQNTGGNNFKIHNKQLQQVINKKLSSVIPMKIDLKTKTDEIKKEGIYETKIFFLYPQSIIQRQLIMEIIKKEYAAYIVNDHEKMLHLLEKYGDSLLFINIDALLSDDEWKKYISNIHLNKNLKNVRVGILSHSTNEKKEEYYLMELMISCGYIMMKSNFNESLNTILKVLDANEARGKRKFVRVKCSEMENVSCSLRLNNLVYKGKIIDISSAGMAFSLMSENETYFKENTEIESIQLLLKGKICHLSGRIKGERHIDGKIIYVMLFEKTGYSEKDKIHEFIFQALQDEISRDLLNI
jgi:GGDEF domain-containing protein